MAAARDQHILLEVADRMHFVGQFAGLQAARQRHRLIVQGGLGLRQELGDFGSLLGSRILVSLMLESRRDDFLLALRDLRSLIPSTPASATPAARLRLRKLALVRVGLDEQPVGVGFRVGILSGGVDADQIAGNPAWGNFRASAWSE